MTVSSVNALEQKVKQKKKQMQPILPGATSRLKEKKKKE